MRCRDGFPQGDARPPACGKGFQGPEGPVSVLAYLHREIDEYYEHSDAEDGLDRDLDAVGVVIVVIAVGGVYGICRVGIRIGRSLGIGFAGIEHTYAGHYRDGRRKDSEDGVFPGSHHLGFCHMSHIPGAGVQPLPDRIVL